MLKIKFLLLLFLFSATVTPTFAQDKIKKLASWPSNLSTLDFIPSSNIIEKVALIDPTQGGKLDEQSFGKLMDTAKPLNADDPKIKGWQYAPWYRGSFVVEGETYNFQLFLGGMGALLTPNKEHGMFSFEDKFQNKENIK